MLLLLRRKQPITLVHAPWLHLPHVATLACITRLKLGMRRPPRKAGSDFGGKLASDLAEAVEAKVP